MGWGGGWLQTQLLSTAPLVPMADMSLVFASGVRSVPRSLSLTPRCFCARRVGRRWQSPLRSRPASVPPLCWLWFRCSALLPTRGMSSGARQARRTAEQTCETCRSHSVAPLLDACLDVCLLCSEADSAVSLAACTPSPLPLLHAALARMALTAASTRWLRLHREGNRGGHAKDGAADTPHLNTRPGRDDEQQLSGGASKRAHSAWALESQSTFQQHVKGYCVA